VCQRNVINTDYDLKYRTFLVHKWDILKSIKQEMLESRIAEINKARGLCKLMVVCQAVRICKQSYQKMINEREVRKILQRRAFTIGMMRIRIMSRLRKNGNF
jgi:capsular polysaccharide biosynthesis protein